MFERLRLYAHTLRHLRGNQWWWLLRRRVMPRGLPGRTPVTQVTWNDSICARLVQYLDAVHTQHPPDAARIGSLLQGNFEILNQPVSLGNNPPWHDTSQSRLWRYHLHYFEYARELAQSSGADSAAQVHVSGWIEHWIAQNPPGTDVAWDPYTISVRVVNWILAASRWPGLRPHLEQSLAVQVMCLLRAPEHEIQANHIFRNAAALSLATAVLGLKKEHQEARSLLNTALDEQLFDDGGHYERSPMYHTEVLKDLLLLHVALAKDSAPWQVKIKQMTGYLDAMLHADGDFVLFGDAAADPHWSGKDTVALAQNLLGLNPSAEADSVAFPHTGVHRMRNSAATVWIKTGGPSPSYQPGHTHCDMLSFEYSYGGRRVLVDSGTHGYAGSPFREYNRATRAHNTSAVDGVEQHECWSVFRVARRGRCGILAWNSEENLPWLKAQCANYLGGAFVRIASLAKDGGLAVADRVLTPGARTLTTWLHVHPDWQISQTAEGKAYALQSDAGTLWLHLFGYAKAMVYSGEQDPVQGWYSPRMGLALAAPVLEFNLEQPGSALAGYVISPSENASEAAGLWSTVAERSHAHE